MTTQTDLTIPVSALKFDGAATATAHGESWDMLQIGGLLQTVIARHAQHEIRDQALDTVSVTFDVSADAATGSDIAFTSRIDRKTRTLVFASGLASQTDRHLLKATIVFRIS